MRTGSFNFQWSFIHVAFICFGDLLNVYTQTHVTFVLIWHNFFSRESPFQIDNLFMCIEMLTQGFVSISQILQCLILYISNCCEFKLLSFYFLFVHYCTLTCAIMIMNDVQKKKIQNEISECRMCKELF